MNKTLKKSIAIILAVLAVMSIAAALTACGDDTAKTEPTTAATEATAAQAATQAATQAAAQTQVETKAADQSSADQPADANEEVYAGITKGEAIAEVRQRAGSGAQLISAYTGFDPNGDEAWVITVAPVTNSEEAVYVTYYVTDYFCVAADDYNTAADSDLISESEAIAEVRRQAGTGAQILSSYVGFTPDGEEAWVITVAPVTNSDEEVVVTYYVSNYFCYAVE